MIFGLQRSGAMATCLSRSGPIAQLDRVPDYESGCRGFESLSVHHLPTFQQFPGSARGHFCFCFKGVWREWANIRDWGNCPNWSLRGQRLFSTELLRNKTAGKGGLNSMAWFFEGNGSLTYQAGIGTTRKPEGGAKARKSAVSRGNAIHLRDGV